VAQIPSVSEYSKVPREMDENGSVRIWAMYELTGEEDLGTKKQAKRSQIASEESPVKYPD
jgi:hypothetical protein